MKQLNVGDVIQFRWPSRSGVKRGRIVAITATQFQVDLFDGFGVCDRVFVNRAEVCAGCESTTRNRLERDVDWRKA